MDVGVCECQPPHFTDVRNSVEGIFLYVCVCVCVCMCVCV